MSLNEASSQVEFGTIPDTEIFKFKEKYPKDAAMDKALKFKSSAFGYFDVATTVAKRGIINLAKKITKENIELDSSDIDISYEGLFFKSYWKVVAERQIQYEFDREQIVIIQNTDAESIKLKLDEGTSQIHVNKNQITLQLTECCTRKNGLLEVFDNESGNKDEHFHKEFIEKANLNKDNLKYKKYIHSVDGDKLLKPSLSKTDIIDKVNSILLNSEFKSSRKIQDFIFYNKVELYLVPIHIFKCYKKSEQKTAYIKINSLNGEKLKNDNSFEILSDDKFREIVIDIVAEAASSFVPGSGVVVKTFVK